MPDWEHDPRLIPFPHGPRQPGRHSLRGQSINPGEFNGRWLCSGCVFRSLPRNPPGASRSTSLGFQPPTAIRHQSHRLTHLAADLDLATSGPHFKSPEEKSTWRLTAGSACSTAGNRAHCLPKGGGVGLPDWVGSGGAGLDLTLVVLDSLITHMTLDCPFLRLFLRCEPASWVRHVSSCRIGCFGWTRESVQPVCIVIGDAANTPSACHRGEHGN